MMQPQDAYLCICLHVDGAEMVSSQQKTMPAEGAFIQQSEDVMNVIAPAEVM